MSLFSRKKTKAVVVGLDGVPYSLLNKLSAQGVVPRLTEIMKIGPLRRMEVTVPEISAVSWPSFMTGVDPGAHGIFGFTELVPGTYDTTFPNYASLKAPTIWDRLEQQGKRSVVINQPGTYPARRLAGALVSGFVAIELHKAVFPAKYIGPLRRLNYEIDIDTARARRDHAYALRELESTLEGRQRAVEMFWHVEDWDFFEVIVTGTDRLHHFLWHALVDENHELHSRTINYYRNVDRFVGEMADRYRAETKDDSLTGLFLLSDHGFCALEKEVALNRFLMEKGLVKFTADPPADLSQIAPESKVLVLDPNRVYVHRRGKYPNGRVDAADAPKVLADARAALAEMSYDGKKLVRRFFTREDAYHGPHAASGPDLVAVSINGYDFKGAVDRTEVFGNFGFTGMHNQDDAFLWTAQPCAEVPFITDVAGLILEHLG
jgi:predicted AlkP superfamily phosphohydrolase/phosphomutase